MPYERVCLPSFNESTPTAQRIFFFFFFFCLRGKWKSGTKNNSPPPQPCACMGMHARARSSACFYCVTGPRRRSRCEMLSEQDSLDNEPFSWSIKTALYRPRFICFDDLGDFSIPRLRPSMIFSFQLSGILLRSIFIDGSGGKWIIQSRLFMLEVI